MSVEMMGSREQNMKIMYVDASMDGHHLTYLNYLLKKAPDGSFAALPSCTDRAEGRVRVTGIESIRGFHEYGAWMKALRRIAREEKPDLIHFLDGDTMMRHLGRGLSRFGESRLVITFHHFFEGKAREISMKNMLRNAAAGVFHTEEICGKVRSLGCGSAVCIPYPCFLDVPPVPGEGYKNQPPKLLALGATRYDKGLDLLLEALRRVKRPFKLVIAGKAEDFDEAFVLKNIEPYRGQVELALHFLSDEEVQNFLVDADIIVLPYRKIFDGASGPMCEGLYLGKTILGPDHGSLGSLIRQSHAGYVFESENTGKLAERIEYALAHPCLYDETARQAQQELRPELFAERYAELYEMVVKMEKATP